MTDLQPLVFSVHEVFAERIIAGDKLWEFRKSPPRLALPEMILFYQTAPKQRIVATAIVDLIFDNDPREVWLTTLHRGVTPEEYNAYYKGRDRAVALHLTDVTVLEAPQSLPPGMAPPQSWSRYKGVWS